MREGNRWAISGIGGASFSKFTGQVIGIKKSIPLPVTMATPGTCSDLAPLGPLLQTPHILPPQVDSPSSMASRTFSASADK